MTATNQTTIKLCSVGQSGDRRLYMRREGTPFCTGGLRFATVHEPTHIKPWCVYHVGTGECVATGNTEAEAIQSIKFRMETCGEFVKGKLAASPPAPSWDDADLELRDGKAHWLDRFPHW